MLHECSDLELACTGKSLNVLYETLCFHTHQAVEKAIKAVLIAHNVPITKSQNIGALIKLLPVYIQGLPELQEAMNLTVYAVLCRYPGDLEPVSEKEYKEAVKLAKKVVNWTTKLLSQSTSGLGLIRFNAVRVCLRPSAVNHHRPGGIISN